MAKLTSLWKTEQNNELLKKTLMELKKENAMIAYITQMMLFEEEVQHLLNFLNKNPQVTDTELITEVNQIMQKMNQKAGITFHDRDKYIG